jgi:predicted amidohydrolase
MSNRRVNVAAYQMPAATCYGGPAIESLRAAVRKCEGRGVSLLCCPEGALGGLADYVEDPGNIALAVRHGTLMAALAPLASETVAVVVGFTEVDEKGRWFNAAAVYSRGEVRGIYRKRRPAIRCSRYTAGSQSPLFEVDDVILGILICYDSTDETLVTDLVFRGAQVLFIPTNNAMPVNRAGPELSKEARKNDLRDATELGVPVIRADVVGEASGLVSFGASAITAANGEQICAGGVGTGELIVSEVELPDPAARTIAVPDLRSRRSRT